MRRGGARKKSRVQWWCGGRKTSNGSARPFSGSAPLWAGCIRTGFPCRKTCIDGNCAIQLRSSGICPPGQYLREGWSRRMHTSRRSAAPASWVFEGRRFQASSPGGARALLRLNPCSRAVYTSWPLQDLSVEFDIVVGCTSYFHDKTFARLPPTLIAAGTSTLLRELQAYLPA